MKTRISQFTKCFWTRFMAVILLVSTFMLISGTTASAAEIDTSKVTAEDIAAHKEITEVAFSDVGDGLELVSEITSLEGDGIIATTRIYKKQVAVPYSSEWTSDYFEALKVFTESNAKFEWVTIYVWGNFRWNGTTAYVDEGDGIAYVTNDRSTVRITKDPKAEKFSDCGSNVLFGNKYAYVEKKATATNDITTKEFELELVVNRNGKPHTNPSGALI